MSVNLDHIDLNCDAVSSEQENDVHGFNLLEPKNSVGSTDVEALSLGETQEPVVEKVRDFEGAKDSMGGFERKMESVDGGSIDFEVKIGWLNRGSSDVETGVVDSSVQEAVRVTETQPLKVEENQSCQVEEEVKEVTCVVGDSSSLDFRDSMQFQNESCLASLCGNMDVEVKVADNSNLLPDKDHSRDSAKQTSGGLENQAMEIDEQANTSGGQIVGTSVFDALASQEDDNNRSSALNLVVDLKPYASEDGNVTSDVSVKEAASKPEFTISDLVWGKVRSHPWWPGQIFDASDSSEKAKKYSKRDSYLIAYFGDQTFAWNEASKIKPFRAHFSQMEKQSNLEDFHYAVHCVLDEVSRRVEFGLACPCVPEYSRIKTQIIVNAGIREESCRRDGGDSLSSADSFEPGELVEYIKTLGQLPFGGFDRLEFVTAQAQLLAFNRWKGYSCLPEFQTLGALLESDAEIPLTAEVKHGNEVNESSLTKVRAVEHASFGKGKSRSPDHLSHKRKQISGDSEYPRKREKSLADLMAERRVSVSNVKGGLDGKANVKLISSSSGKKRKAVDSISDGVVVKRSKRLLSSEGDINSSQPKKTYRVGDSILKVASQLNGPTPILKSVNGTSEKTATNNKSKEKSLSRKFQGKQLFPVEDSSPDALFSQLCLVARYPREQCHFLKSIVSFFSEFRNSVCLDHLSSQQHKKSFLEHVSGGDIVNKSTKLEPETSELEHMKDSYWTDMIIQSNPEEQSSPENQNEDGDFPPETPGEKRMSNTEPQSAVQLGSNSDSEQKTAGGILDLEAVKSVDQSEENHNDEPCPTALILKFTNLDSVPSEINLNKIFGRFGRLKESETEVLKKSSRAKVVFCKRADAEVAFSSAGKYSIFGPSLVSYRLKYMPSTPGKSSRSATKHSRKDATSVDGNVC